MCESSESDFIKERVDAIKETIHFFSNDCQSDTEVWVVRRFLSQLRMEFSDDETIPSSDEPVDVVYRDAKFQVKEIMDKDRRRDDENRESLRKAKTATSDFDLLEPEPYRPPKKIDCSDIVPVVAEEAYKLQKRKYGPSECMSTDLLFYFNLKDIYVVGDKFPTVEPYSSRMAAWRSVSVVSNDCALVLHVSQSAPGFLKKAKGKVHRNLSVWSDD